MKCLLGKVNRNTIKCMNNVNFKDWVCKQEPELFQCTAKYPQVQNGKIAVFWSKSLGR